MTWTWTFLMSFISSVTLTLPVIYYIHKHCVSCYIHHFQDTNKYKHPDKVTPTIIKYEHKYLEKYKNAPKDYVFTDTEQGLFDEKYNECSEVEHATDYVISYRLTNLINSFVMENTPVGNVIMRYNHQLGSFEFYSDNTVPYRYLETVARKYVLTHKCCSVYIDMEVNIKDHTQKQRDKETNDKEKQTRDQKLNPPQKNVFVTLKHYNKPSLAGSQTGITTPAPLQKRTNANTLQTSDSLLVDLKDQINKYSFLGKVCDFNFLKSEPTPRLNQHLTFAEYKLLRLY